MKVIVSHFGKQHVNALLTGLAKYGVLTRFYTSIASNRLRLPRFLTKRLANRLRRRAFSGFDADVIVHHPLLLLLYYAAKSEAGHIRLPYRQFDRWVARRLAREDYDLVIGYENAVEATFRAAKGRGKITVLDLAGVHHAFQTPILLSAGVHADANERNFIDKSKEAALSVTDYVFALSRLAARSLIEFGKFPADRVFTVNLGYEPKVFSPKQRYRQDGVLRLYFVGTMSGLKGIPFLIELAEALISKGLDISLTLIGPIGDFDPSRLNKPYLHYVPFLPHEELVARHHALDLFLFPSHIDSWGQVVVEAMGCGSPVFVSENTGARDAVEQGGGLVLPVGHRAAWMDAIELVYRDRRKLQLLGQKAVAVAQQYTWDRYHQQVHAALSEIYRRETAPSQPATSG